MRMSNFFYIDASFSFPHRTNQTEDYFYNQIAAIVANGSNYTTKCGKCLASTDVIHKAAVSQSVSVITDLLIRICESACSQIAEILRC